MKRNILAWILLLALFGLDFMVGLFRLGGMENDAIRNVLFGLGQLIAVLAGIYAVTMFGLKSVTGRSIAYITVGIFLWLVGGAVFAVNDAVGNSPGFPSIADAIILLGYPLFFIGFFNEMHSGKIPLRGKRQLFLYCVGIALAVIVTYFEILLPFDPSAGFLVNAVQTCYGIADLVLIFCSVIVLLVTIDYQGGKIFYSWLSIFVGVVIQLLADILFGVYAKQYTDKTGINIFIDLIWRFGYVFSAYGFLSAGMLVEQIQTKIRMKLPGSHS
jgi:hypothetical protein